MKRYFIVIVAFLGSINAFCQMQHGLLFFFDEIKKDSTVNTLGLGIRRSYPKEIPDSLSLRYFFEDTEEKLYTIVEAYNFDDNTYTEIRYKRIVRAVFSKSVDSIILLCYRLDGVNYLSIYDKSKDSIVSVYQFHIPARPETGEAFTQSILFPNNYIFTIETSYTKNDKIETRVKLVEIDYVNKIFIEHKNVLMESAIIIDMITPDYEKYQKAFELVGISMDGELLNTNQ